MERDPGRTLNAAAPTGDAAALRATLARFLAAIDAGDAAALAECWCEDASMWFPFAGNRALVEGRAAILAGFETLFERLRARRPPPLVGFEVLEFAARPLGAGHALVIALLGFGAERGQRTLVFRREAGEWRLLHVHASNVGG